MGLHQFCLDQHKFAARKLLKARINQHQVISDSSGTPTLANAAYLTVPDGVSLLEMVAMSQSYHARLRVVLDTIIGRYLPVTQVMEAVFIVLI